MVPMLFVGSSGYDQAGPGTVSFLSQNNYAGGTFLDGGTLQVAANSTLA